MPFLIWHWPSGSSIERGYYSSVTKGLCICQAAISLVGTSLGLCL